ncbi:helix-turn-helix transcriptional regulator [Steroidobacter flavus]|uniref:Helix-turn-helix transcriptional regulator n=1 Tax=Steroidobacter flavus TaxID=1842136 RepID=A0ABV8SZL3_9GAMM
MSRDSTLVCADSLRGFDEIVTRLGGSPHELRDAVGVEFGAEQVSHRQLYEMATSFIERRCRKGVMPLTTPARIHIARLLVEGNCTQESLAAALRLHRRTLQRKLRREGKSFETLRDSVRRDMALRYLQQPDISLMRVTEMLGYSEASVLSRSCVRWFLASPRELRRLGTT